VGVLLRSRGSGESTKAPASAPRACRSDTSMNRLKVLHDKLTFRV
jgi:hypothetical protein